MARGLPESRAGSEAIQCEEKGPGHKAAGLQPTLVATCTHAEVDLCHCEEGEGLKECKFIARAECGIWLFGQSAWVRMG